MSKSEKVKPAQPEPAKQPLILPEEVENRAAAVNHNGGAQQASDTPAEGLTEIKEIMMASCGNCRFFVPQAKTKSRTTQQEIEIGGCRAHAPTPIVVGMQQHPITQQMQPLIDGYFPPTNEELWCGDYLPRHSLIDVN